MKITSIDQIMNHSTPTADQKKAALAVLIAVTETIRELGRVPSGHLYAQLMGKMDLAGYNAMVRTLTNTGLVKLSADELIWTGPKF